MENPVPGCGRPRRDATDYHPLEVIPYFQRFRPSIGRDLVYTLIWSTGLGLIFWALALIAAPAGSIGRLLYWNVLMANVIGYLIHGLFAAGAFLGVERRARGSGSLAMMFYYAGTSTLGVVAGLLLVSAFRDQPLWRWFANPRWVVTIAVTCLLISAILAAIFFAREKGARAEAELERERARAERIEREAALANLRALQAQIEPHFLFNTLANVASLIDTRPDLAKGMVESFNRFLRASLAATRSETTTLAEEGRLICAFLDVLQVRMGERLSYAVDIPGELGAFALPPMLLQPVVENAIKHGIEPKVEGGRIDLVARREGDGVVVEVADTGVGFASTTRGGVGLANLRGRLQLLYGPQAKLEIGENRPSGTRVVVRIPR
jgi:signal transduction histidine kinase